METTSRKKAVCLAVISVGVIFIASFASPTQIMAWLTLFTLGSAAVVLHSQEETIMTEVRTRDIPLPGVQCRAMYSS
jgi:hypothetical protein